MKENLRAENPKMSSLRRVSSFCSTKLAGNPMFSQLSQSVQDDGPQAAMYFVIPPGKTQEDYESSNMEEMFEVYHSQFLSEWIEDEKSTKITLQGNGNIFVFDNFESPGFKYWEAKQANGSSHRLEIIGPHVLRYVFNSSEVLAVNTKGFPTFTLAMRNIVISLSGFNKNKKAELERLIKLMNGTTSSQLTKAVTHVVSGNAFTKKCREAQKEQIPIMTENWIREVWTDNQSDPVEASDKRYVNHVCPVFYNINVCMSQITPGRKNTLKAGIERLGGIYHAELKRGVIDVLVAINPTGEKYKHAMRWNIECVSPEWVENSTENGMLLPPEDFSISQNRDYSKNLISTPAHSHVPDLEMTKCSMIEDQSSRMYVNETANLSRTQLDGPNPEDAITRLRAVKDSGAYLDGCRVYVVDYEKSYDLKKLLNASGATRLDQLCEGVTHVIVTGEKLPKSVQERLKELESMPYLVTLEWVIKSAEDGNPVDEELYRFDLEHSTKHKIAESYVVAAGGHQMPFPSMSTGISVQSSKPGRNNTVSTRSSNSYSNDDGDSDTNNAVSANTSYNPTMQNEESSGGLLDGITFKVHINDDEEREFVNGIIIEHTGTLTQGNADVSILPPVCNSVDKEKSEKAYTKYWLFDCVELGSLDIPNSFHYFPMGAVKKADTFFQDVVVAISQYSPSEREYLIELIKAMDGRFQDVFAKKDSTDKKNLRSTHLICKTMDTDKAKAAKRWGVPVIVAEWVVESFSQRVKLPEDRFNPEKQNTSEPTVFMPTPRRRTMNNKFSKQSKENNSIRSVYPPSTAKGEPKCVIKGRNRTPEPDKPDVEKASSSKFAKPRPKENPEENEMPTRRAIATALAQDDSPVPSTSKKGNNISLNLSGANANDGAALVDGDCSSDEEHIRKIAEMKAKDPYSDESFQRFMDEIKARGIDLNDYSSFTPSEDARLCNPNPDSPLIMDYPRHESRAIKEQLEVVLKLSPVVGKIPLRQPTSTPLSELIKKFNVAYQEKHPNDTFGSFSSPSHHGSPPVTSTPKSGGAQTLRKVAALNRRSQGMSSVSQNEFNGDPAPGIRKLVSKRPSDGSPEEYNETNTAKRPRKSSEDDNDLNGEDDIKSKSPNENNLPADIQNEKQSPTVSPRKSDRMQALSNLLAQNQADQSEKGNLSPIKRRSADSAKNLLPTNDDNDDFEAMEQPHLSWGEDSSRKEKMSTVKKAGSKPLVVVQPESKPEPEEDTAREPKTRSSRAQKTSSVAPSSRRTRSQSKTRDNVPIGHQPIQVGDTKAKSSKKTAKAKQAFPIEVVNAPVFMLSSMSDKEKAEATALIENLGGKVSSVVCFDSTSFALLTTSLIRSEKLLGCIASGKFVLKMQYLQSSESAGRFLPIEQDFLWHGGNITQQKEYELANASFQWLKARIEGRTQGPMFGMKFCILNYPPERLEAYKRLALAGGGEVVPDREDATVIIQDEKGNKSKEWNGIPVKNPLYLNSLILAGIPT